MNIHIWPDPEVHQKASPLTSTDLDINDDWILGEFLKESGILLRKIIKIQMKLQHFTVKDYIWKKTLKYSLKTVSASQMWNLKILIKKGLFILYSIYSRTSV